MRDQTAMTASFRRSVRPKWPNVTKLPLAPAYVVGVFNLRGSIVPLIDIAMTEGRRPGLLPKHVVVASLHAAGQHDVLRLGIASDEVIGTYSVGSEDILDRSVGHVQGDPLGRKQEPSFQRGNQFIKPAAHFGIVRGPSLLQSGQAIRAQSENGSLGRVSEPIVGAC